MFKRIGLFIATNLAVMVVLSIVVSVLGFLTFLLNPFVTWFRQRGLPRTPAVILVVLIAATALGGVGWLVTAQITSLLQELPKYSQNVKQKVRSFKEATEGSGQLQKMINDLLDISRIEAGLIHLSGLHDPS